MAEPQALVPPPVRVRLLQNQEVIHVSGMGMTIQHEEKSTQQVSIPRSQQTLTIRRQKIKDDLFWRIEDAQRAQVRFIADRSILLQAQSLRIGGTEMPRKVLLVAGKKIEVIGLLNMQDYLYGVIAKEMPASWPLEALKAQAIAARSYVLYMQKLRAKLKFDVESSIMDQVYSKIENLNLSRQQAQSIRLAVDETSGLFLRSPSGQLVKTYYHADCGGVTASSESVFGAKGLVGGAKDASCPLNPKANWSLVLSKNKLYEKMANYFKLPLEYFNGLKMEITAARAATKQADSGGRIQLIQFVLQNGQVHKMKANQLREMLGYQELKSTQFQLQENQQSFLFQGKGFGHGVGLCQWGTKKMAEQGADSQQILAHYYPELILNAAKHFHSEKRNSNQDKNFFN